MLQSWLAERLLRWVLARLRAGDSRPLVWLDRPDVELVFPGRSSFAGTIRGREEHRRWLERLVDVGLQNHLDEVVAVGPPWRTTVVVRGTDHARGSDGTIVYENRYVLWATLRWGRLARYEVYEDTERTAAFDAWLEGRSAA